MRMIVAAYPSQDTVFDHCYFVIEEDDQKVAKRAYCPEVQTLIYLRVATDIVDF